MMRRCEVTKGFFVVKICGKTPSGICSKCQKYICKKHSTNFRKKDALCVECDAQLDANTYHDEYMSDRWYYSTRSRFYRDHHYSPFDDYDRDSFNNIDNSMDMDNEGDASFYDS